MDSVGAYDENETAFCGDRRFGKVVVKHIDIKYARNEDMTDIFNMHLIIICLNKTTSSKKFSKLVRQDNSLNMNEKERFPIDCVIISHQVIVKHF